MSTKHLSRAFAEGTVRQLARMKRPSTLVLEALPVRNPIVRAAAQRAISSAAGKHIRSRGAQRRADNMALQRLLRASVHEQS